MPTGTSTIFGGFQAISNTSSLVAQVGAREVVRFAQANAHGSEREDFERAFLDFSVDTCVACGLCEMACPVSINTGALSKVSRERHVGPIARSLASLVGHYYDVAISVVRGGLKAASAFEFITGERGLDVVGALMRTASGSRGPLISRRSTPTAGTNVRARKPGGNLQNSCVVYFASCAGRMFGPARDDRDGEPVAITIDRLLEKAGFDVIVPPRQAALCCGQPFDSKGLAGEGDKKAEQAIEALLHASEHGRWPIFVDTSPCSQRLKAAGAG